MKRRIPDSQKKAVSRYVKANYDSFTVRGERSLKDKVRKYAEMTGESINQYILRAVKNQMEADYRNLEMYSISGMERPREKHTWHIMLEDRPVADILLSNDHREITYTLFMPAGCNQPFSAGRLDLNRFYRFLKDRCYEDTRGDLEEILQAAGMKANDPWIWVKKTHGVTWHDHIWVRFDDEKITWEEVKLRD